MAARAVQVEPTTMALATMVPAPVTETMQPTTRTEVSSLLEIELAAKAPDEFPSKVAVAVPVVSCISIEVVAEPVVKVI